MDEIRGAGKAMRKTYSYKLTESQGPRNKEVHRFQKSCLHRKTRITITACGLSKITISLPSLVQQLRRGS